MGFEVWVDLGKLLVQAHAAGRVWRRDLRRSAGGWRLAGCGAGRGWPPRLPGEFGLGGHAGERREAALEAERPQEGGEACGVRISPVITSSLLWRGGVVRETNPEDGLLKVNELVSLE